MRALMPSSPIDDPDDPGGVDMEDVDLHDYYGAGWLEHGGVRANFVASTDGAATVAGVSKGLQTEGDNRVFAALRDLADVVLVGAGTLRDERYGALVQNPERAALRRKLGLAETLPLAVVTRSLGLNPAWPVFSRAEPGARTIVVTCEAVEPARLNRLGEVADVIVCGGFDVDLPAARREFDRRGLTRILCEGGPTLFAELVAADVVDELCLSVTPRLAGPGAGRITAGLSWPSQRQLQLVGLLEEDSALFCRYHVVR